MEVRMIYCPEHGQATVAIQGLAIEQGESLPTGYVLLDLSELQKLGDDILAFVGQAASEHPGREQHAHPDGAHIEAVSIGGPRTPAGRG